MRVADAHLGSRFSDEVVYALLFLTFLYREPVDTGHRRQTVSGQLRFCRQRSITTLRGTIGYFEYLSYSDIRLLPDDLTDQV